MAQGDYLIQNQSFPSFRSDLNSTLEAINTSNSGTSRPTSAVAGTVWLDTTNATNPTLKFFDGTDDISLAQLDYSANTVNWLDSTVTVDVVGDTTPQLGGNLDVNGNSIVSVANGNITITPDGTGKLVVSGLSYPTTDGTNGQALITDGSGNLSFGDVAGGTNWQSSIVTGTTLSAVAGNGYWIDTTSNACTVTLPASPSVGDTIEFIDYARTFATNNLTLSLNSLNYQGGTSNPVYSTNGQHIRIVYSGATKGWTPTDDDESADTQIYSAEMLIIAGGGGGGGSGGGAGGYRTSTQNLSVGNTYTITVGGGGASGAPSSYNSTGSAGGNSSISGTGITTITSAGGAGGVAFNADGADGGSGSGGGGKDSGGSTATTGGSGNVPAVSPSQGNNGGNGYGAPTAGAGGGGGGASAVGQGGNTRTGGNGGDGTASPITGSSVTRAGGGGGGSISASPLNGSGGAGGAGGGGQGACPPSSPASTAGTTNTGSGGGGGGLRSPLFPVPSDGGSGIVILRVPTANYSGTTTGSPTVSTVGTDTIMQFTASGSYTA